MDSLSFIVVVFEFEDDDDESVLEVVPIRPPPYELPNTGKIPFLPLAAKAICFSTSCLVRRRPGKVNDLVHISLL